MASQPKEHGVSVWPYPHVPVEQSPTTSNCRDALPTHMVAGGVLQRSGVPAQAPPALHSSAAVHGSPSSQAAPAVTG